MKSLIVILMTCSIVVAFGQDNTYEPVPCTIIDQQNKNDFGGGFYGHHCIETDGVLQFDSDQNYSIKAGDYIHIYNETIIDPDNNYQFHAFIEKDPIELAWYSPDFAYGVVGKYEKLEIGVKLPQQLEDEIDLFIQDYDDPNGLNPFLEWEIKVTAYFIHSSGLVKSVDGFFYKHFERNVVPYTGPKPVDDFTYKTVGGSWDEVSTEHRFRCRFAPPETGSWQCFVKVVVPGSQYVSGYFDFDVIDYGNPGFIRVGENKRYLVRGNETYIPMGPNYICPTTYAVLNPETAETFGIVEDYRPFTAPLQSFLDYEENLGKVADEGANHIRYIMCPWSSDIEFERIGNYYDRMHIAYEMDRMLNKAKLEGLTIQWNMLVHYNLTSNEYWKGWWDWSKREDYSFCVIDNGIPDNGYCYRENEYFSLDNPEDFLSDPQAKTFYKQRLRYIISRWGYSTEIEMFELMSEMSNIGNIHIPANNCDPCIDQCQDLTLEFASPYGNSQVQQDVSSWTNEMSTYIKDVLDHDEHLISVSYSNPIGDDDNTYIHDNIDIVGRNAYNPANGPADFWHRVTKPNNYGPLSGIQSIEDITTAGGGDLKPIIFSECGDLNSTFCAPGVEIEKTIWISPFTGLALANDWNIVLTPEYWYHYGNVLNFINGRNFDGENWMAGQWLTNSNSAWNKMEGDQNRIDMFYLRKEDKSEAIGVVNNRTYNYFTQGSGTACSTEPNTPNNVFNPFDQYHMGGDLDNSNNGLVLKKMQNEDYKIQYFDINGNYLGESFDNGQNVKVEYPNFSGGLVYFIATVQNNMAPVNNLNDDPQVTKTDIDTIQTIIADESFEFQVYPNPTSDYILIYSPVELCSASIHNLTGAAVLSGQSLVYGLNKLDLEEIAAGTYVLVLTTSVETKKFKIVIR